jgi:hypothetical protein
MTTVIEPRDPMRRIKDYIKKLAPGLVSLRNRLRARYLKSLPAEKIFTDYYEHSTWGDPNTRSGRGSSLERTAYLRQALPELIKELGAKSMLDIPCGDYYWLQQIDLNLPSYIGADIVAKIVDGNNQRFANEKTKFEKLDLLKDNLPAVDIVFCRDCLVHFSYDDVAKAVERIRSSKSTYLLTTTFCNLDTNTDIYTGDWRPINLQRPPFNFPAPTKLLDERSPWPTDVREGKSLGLWKIADL